ncbi:MAG TPA: hypothetical protein VGP48_10760 [Stellaceae bacterium]|jgi:hypothetical protein|nr:hypothetical protein [Stellaceae bacterium]
MNWRPELVLDTAMPADHRALDGREFAVVKDGLTFACQFNATEGANRLVVIPESWVDRSKEAPPRFHRWNWGPRMASHVLSVNDPTLFLDDEIVTGCFLGDRERDPIVGLVEIAAWFAASMGLSDSRTIFYGASAGGFAAIRAAASAAHGRAISVNAMMDIACHDNRHLAAKLADVFGTGLSLGDIKELSPCRISAVAALQTACAEGRNPRVLAVQNTRDSNCYRNHFLPMCQAFAIPAGGGVDPRDRALRALPMAWEGGHGDGAEGIVEQIFGAGLVWLLGSLTAA